MKELSSGTISGRGAWATIFVLMIGGFPLAFAAAIPLAIACKALLDERNRTVRTLVLLNVFLSGWLAAWAATRVEVYPSSWLSNRLNAAALDFYSGMNLFGPTFMTAAWMNIFLLPSTAAFIMLGIKRNRNIAP